MLIVVLFPCLVDPDKLGNRLLDACWINSGEDAILLLEEGEWICSVIVCTCVCVSKLNIFSPFYMMTCKVTPNGFELCNTLDVTAVVVHFQLVLSGYNSFT